MRSSDSPSVRSLLQAFFQLHADDAARLLENLEVGEIVRLLEAIPGAEAGPAFQRLSLQTGAQVLERLPEESARVLLETLDPPRSAILLLRCEPETQERLLGLLSARTAKELRIFMSYPLDSAAHGMDPQVPAFRPETTVEQVIERLRSLGRKRIHDVFLVDGEGSFLGAVALQDLLPASRDERLEDLLRTAPISVLAMASQEEVVEILDRHKLTTLPVVDVEGRLLGAIRHDALVKAVEQEASADIQSMVGAGKEERALSKVSFAVRKRLPWLQVNLATAFLAAAVVGLFENTIARFTALAVLLPVVAGQSGNTGAQALAVTMRGLTLREIRSRNWLRMVLKEAAVGMLNGWAVAAVTSLGVYLWSGSLGLSLVIGSAMVLSMVIAGVAGTMIPIILSAFGQDPAQSSSILLTTVTDVVGFFSFLGLATLLAAML